MGWKDGLGLGKKNQGRTEIIQTQSRMAQSGLGNSPLITHCTTNSNLLPDQFQELLNLHWDPMTLTKMWPEKRCGTDTMIRTRATELPIYILPGAYLQCCSADTPFLFNFAPLGSSLLVILL